MNSSTGGFIVFVVAIFLIVAAGVYLSMRRAKRRDQTAQSWPTIEGKILTSKVMTKSESETTGQVDYTAAVTYAYAVGGKEFKGHRIGFLAFGSTRQEAAEVAARYVPGAAVTVHYNPTKPKDSALELGRR